ncbi:hypothetical protein PD885_03737 [Xanthomonas fragariae]|uniref:Uncharacterized protein n=1 Tax=Xanthomonas fragariae TaxID=48664 RepID=A0ABY1RUP4_9XANT|nr:hypothetical protein PD885_03737 [Xanthomonas fragariae]
MVVAFLLFCMRDSLRVAFTSGSNISVVAKLVVASRLSSNQLLQVSLESQICSVSGIAADADGRPMLSPELSQMVNRFHVRWRTDVNAQLRGVGEQAWTVHEKVKIVQSRRPADQTKCGNYPRVFKVSPELAEMGAGHWHGRQAVPGVAGGAVADYHGVARDLGGPPAHRDACVGIGDSLQPELTRRALRLNA